MDEQFIRDLAEVLAQQYGVDAEALVKMVLSGQLRVDPNEPAMAMDAWAKRNGSQGGSATPTPAAPPTRTPMPSPAPTATPTRGPQMSLTTDDGGAGPTDGTGNQGGVSGTVANGPPASRGADTATDSASGGGPIGGFPNDPPGSQWIAPNGITYKNIGGTWTPQQGRFSPGPPAPTASPSTTGAGSTSPGSGAAPGMAPDRATAEAMARTAARKAGVDPDLYVRLITNESGFGAPTSSAGAIGPAQLMPDTARGLGVDPYSYQANLEGGARYLKQMIDRYGGNVQKALTAYNWGPGNLESAGGDITKAPPATRAYVARVAGGSATAGVPQGVTGDVDSGRAPSPLDKLPNPGNTFGGTGADRNGTPWNIRPYAGLTPDKMNPQEGNHYFPWDDPSQGGEQQATYNLLTGMGINPNNGNPWNSFLQQLAPGVFDSARIQRMMSGAEPSQNTNALDTQLTMDTLRKGNTSAFPDFGDMINQLRGASHQSASRGLDEKGLPQADDNGNKLPLDVLLQAMNSGNGGGAAQMLTSLASPFISPGMQKYLGAAIQARLNRFRQQGMDSTTQSPIDVLTAGWA